jgi:hypothetical protein
MNRQELEKKNIAALRSLAKTHSIRLRPSMRKSEIISALLEALSPEERREPAASTEKEAITASRMTEHAGESEAQEERVEVGTATDPEIPTEYGVNRVVALVRDPWWIHSYWEVTQDGIGETHQKLADPESRLTLRVYDLSERTDLTHFWDIEIYNRVGNWYVDVGRPDRNFLIDIGMKSRSGAFATIARSNLAHTPPAGPSDRFDEEWWAPEGSSASDEGRRLPLEPFERERQAISATSPVSSLGLLRRG